MANRYIQKVTSLDSVRNLPSAAGIGIFGNGLFVNGDGTPYLVAGVPIAKEYYVDANSGSNSNDGRSWGSAFLTMAQAFSVLASGDSIYFRGKIKEQLTTPVQVFDVKVIGVGNRPRHADSTPAGGEINSSTWAAPDSPAATTALVKVIQQGWSFQNILFAPPSDAEAITLFRNGGAGNAERDASHATIIGCRFAGGLNGIGSNGQPFNVGIYNNVFQDATGFAIRHSVLEADAGIANPLMWHLEGNYFIGNANHVKAEASKWRIYRNTFDDGGTPNTTVVLDLGTTGGNNFILDNDFQTTTANFNTPDIVGYSTDVWNNRSIDGQASSVGREIGQPA